MLFPQPRGALTFGEQGADTMKAGIWEGRFARGVQGGPEQTEPGAGWKVMNKAETL